MRLAPSAASRSCSAPAVVPGTIGMGSARHTGPSSSPCVMRMIDTPVTASPAMTARWIGAAPRQRGKSEAWML
jgi:hypothetical protein